MNRPPEILVDSGFEVDQNGALDEIVIPQVVTTFNAPRKVTFLGQTLNYIPSTVAALQEFDAPNYPAIATDIFKGYTNLTSASFASATSIYNEGSTTRGSTSGAFYGCTGLVSVNLPTLVTISDILRGVANGGTFYSCISMTTISLPSLTTITIRGNEGGNVGAFYGCTGLVSVNLPSLTTITSSSGSYSTGNCGTFYGCTGLTSVSLPKLATCTDTGVWQSTFGACTSLESVQLGSEGNPVTSLGQYMFKGCTQSNLTITVYTNGGASLANAPWGATNATIEYEEA